MKTKVTIHENGTTVVLPCGFVVEGNPQLTPGSREHQTDVARELGYGDDVLQMVKDHDAMHAALVEWLGIPVSYSLRTVSGEIEANNPIALCEENTVLAVQKFMRLAKGRMPRV